MLLVNERRAAWIELDGAGLMLDNAENKKNTGKGENDRGETLMRTLFIAAIATVFASTLHAQPIGLGTGPQGTLTYQIGAAVSKTLQEAGNIQSRVQPSTGTTTVVPLVNSGEIELSFANTLELSDAYNGVGIFHKKPNPKLRAVAVIFPIKVGLLVRADSPIKSIQDMKGKTVAYGFPGQETLGKTVDAMLATGGLSVKDLKTAVVPNVIRGVDELVAGRLDITTFAIGGAKVAEAHAAVGIRFIPIGDGPGALAALKKEFPPAYLAKVMPAPNLAGVKDPMTTMFYDYTIFANADVPADRIKTITRILAENKTLLAQGQPLFNNLSPERMYTNINVPFHDGAVAFYREKGIKEIK